MGRRTRGGAAGRRAAARGRSAHCNWFHRLPALLLLVLLAVAWTLLPSGAAMDVAEDALAKGSGPFALCGMEPERKGEAMGF